MIVKVAFEIDVDRNRRFCGPCSQKFRCRTLDGMRWVCNLFRAETDDGHTGTCLNSQNNKPMRCRACQDSELLELKERKSFFRRSSMLINFP